MGSEPPPFPKPRYKEYKKTLRGAEWPQAILKVIAPKDEDSGGMKALKIGGIILSPIVIAPAALAGFAVDKITNPMMLPVEAWIRGELHPEPYYLEHEVIAWCMAHAKWAQEQVAAAQAAAR
jgi:hypothetical protein